MRIPLTKTGELFWLGENQVPFNFAMMARIRGPFSISDLSVALCRAAERHPLARIRLEMDQAGQGWLTTQDVAEIPLRVVTVCNDWMDVVEEELACPFTPAAGPQVRAVWIQDNGPNDGTEILILIFNHNACDGMSGAFFTRDVLQLLGEPNAALPQSEPCVEELVKLIPKHVASKKWMQLQLMLIRSLAPLAWMVQKRLPRPVQPEAVPGFCLLTWSLTAEQTSALVDRCHAEGTSVHAAICTAWLRADAEIEKLDQPGSSWMRTVSTPVNLRDWLDRPVGDSFGLFMSTISTRVDCSNARRFWDIAREIKRRQARALSGDRKFHWPLRTFAALSGLSAADRRGVLALLSSQRPGFHLGVTNLGRLDFPTRAGLLRFETLYGPLVNGFPFERTVSVLTFGGVMNFAFAFRGFLLDRPGAWRIQRRAMEILENAVYVN